MLAGAVRTDAQLRALRCRGDERFLDVSVRDPQIPGFLVRVYPSGRKAFYLLYRRLRRRHRVKLGVYSPPQLGLAAARSKARQILASVTQGANPAAAATEARQTDDVRSLYAEFEREVVLRFPSKTRVNWNGTSRRFLSEIGHLPITATDEICSRVMDLHKRVGLEERKETLAHTLFKHVSRFFKWAVEERKLKPSQFPLGGMRSRFRDKKRTRYYDPGEVQRLFQAINSPRTWWPEGVSQDAITKRDHVRAAVHRCYFLLLWYVGCRRGALASLRWDEIRPDHASPDEWLWYRRTSKNSDPLEIPLSSYAMKVLRELGPSIGEAAFVFPSQRADGTTGHRSESWKAVRRLQAASGVLDFTNHAVRKTISTYMTRSLDVPTDVVTAILNHRLPGPKANENYIQALPVRRMREAFEAWGDHLHALQGRSDGQVFAQSASQRPAPARVKSRRVGGPPS